MTIQEIVDQRKIKRSVVNLSFTSFTSLVFLNRIDSGYLWYYDGSKQEQTKTKLESVNMHIKFSERGNKDQAFSKLLIHPKFLQEVSVETLFCSFLLQ